MRLSALVASLALVLGIGSCDEESNDLVRVVLRPNAALTSDELDGARDVMAARIQRLDLKGATIERRGQELVAELPRSGIERAVSVLVKEGKLELWDLQGDLLAPTIDANGNPRPSASRVRAGKGSVLLRCGPPATYCPGVTAVPAGRGFHHYLVRYQPNDRAQPVPELTGADFKVDEIRQEFDPNGGPVVLLSFTPEGAEKFEKLTLELAERGRVHHNRLGGEPSNTFQQLAIAVDRQILSAPAVDFQANPAGISAEAGVQIAQFGPLEEARDLAIALQSGQLPAPFHRVRE